MAIILQELIRAVRSASVFNAQIQVPPACILWPDKERQWEAIVPRLQEQMPELCVLGKYDAAARRGHEVLGRSLDELPPQTRRLLTLLEEWVRELCEQKAMEQDDFHFSRRQVRERTGWGDTQLKVHLCRLVEMEYLLMHRNPQHSQGFLYELVYDGGGRGGERFLPGLIDPEAFGKSAVESAQNVNTTQTGRGESQTGRGAVGPRSAGGRGEARPVSPANEAASRPKSASEAENAQGPLENRRVS